MTIVHPYLQRRSRSLAEYRAELVMLMDIRRHESECVMAMQRRLLAALNEFAPVGRVVLFDDGPLARTKGEKT